MNKNIILKAEDLSKKYQLGEIGFGSLAKDLNSLWYKFRKKDDLNKKLEFSEQKITNEFWALKNINLEIERGDIMGIVGENGAGKSTLLKIFSKITAPTTGFVKYNGHISSILEVGTGFNQELTGRENIFLNGSILGMKKKDISAKFNEIVDFSEIGQFIDTPVKRYSSGMYVRLAFSVASHLNSEILIIDEALAVGDANFHERAIQKIKSVSINEGRTIIFVSHNIKLMSDLCNSAILLKNGSLVTKGKVVDVMSEYINMTENLVK
jgi:lipopolysaccharide transport system ATP-binding protein